MTTKRKNWHMYFNPCGGMAVNGFELRRCFLPCKKREIACLSAGAFQVLGYLLDGNTISVERNDYRDFLRKEIGREVIDLEGNIIILSQENTESLLDLVMQKVQQMLNIISTCIEFTIPVTEEYLDKCSSEQKDVLSRLEELSRKAGSFSGTQEEAEELVGKMRATLEQAIELDLDELGLVVRQALAYGLGEIVLAKRNIPNKEIIQTKVGVLQKA